MRKGAGLAWVLAWSCFAHAGEDYAAWAHSRDLIVDASGAGLAGELAGYPLAVAIGDRPEGLFAQAKPAGADLRFASADGTRLPYQIESWDAAAREAAVWVRLPSLKPGQVLRIKAYWGNPAAADSSNGPAVFRAEDGFRGVWHLSSAADACAGASDARDSGTAAEPAGRIGGARRFANPDAYAAQGAYLALGNPAALDVKGVITLEAWVKWDRRDGHRIVICRGGASGTPYETVLRIGESRDYRAGVWTGTSHYAAAPAPAADSNAWTHLGGVFTGNGWLLYRNGALLAATPADTNGAKPSPGGWRIGAEYANGVTRFFSGDLDEVRVSAAARGVDWFRMDYASQREGQTAVRWAEDGTGLRPALPYRTGPRLAPPGARAVFPVPYRGSAVDALGLPASP